MPHSLGRPQAVSVSTAICGRHSGVPGRLSFTCNVTSRFALSAAACSARMAASPPPAAPVRHHVLSLRPFSISRTFLIALAILAVRRSANAGSAPLLRNFSSALLGACCDIPTFDEIRFLKDLDPLHPWLANLRRFPHHACASRQLSLPQEYQCQRYAKRGYSAETIGYVATTPPATPPPPPVPPSSNQQPRQPQAQFQLSSV